jgi:hypothetical protein
LRFQNGSKFVAANRVAGIAFAVTADFFCRRPSLEPKLKRFAYYLRTILVGGLTGNLDCAQESLIEAERNSFRHDGDDTNRDLLCQSIE